jgi:pyrimidine-nucleoside phosphorylase
MPIHPLDVILHKRDGRVLSDLEIHGFINAVVHRTDADRTPRSQITGAQVSDAQVTDAQIASFLMAVFQRGLNPKELAALTQAMRFSGEVFDSKPLGTFLVDKHSTGGVGDKSSLLIAPILAAVGVASPLSSGTPGVCIPMISGRSLGHTGGTLDKLETIPGFNTQLSLAQMEAVLRRCGAALVGQTPRLVPADRILYALRDHTGTVESPHLIAASIMSKKLAEGLDALVLDVKTGSGAFMKSEADARNLADLMVAAGNAAGTKTVALLTRMDQPLGRYAGNWLEVLECVDIMQGRRHPLSTELIELSNTLVGWMLFLAGFASTPAEGARLSDSLLASGAAYKQWLAIVEAQGGDTTIFEDPSRFHRPAAHITLTAQSSGFLFSMDASEVGWAIQRLGAGRKNPGDPVSAHAGIEVHARLGDRVEQGQPLVTLFSEDKTLLAEPLEMMRATYCIAPEPPLLQPIVGEIINNSRQ